MYKIDLRSEVWRPALGFEGLYEVSDHGRVRSVRRFFIRRDGQRQGTGGYFRKLQVASDAGHLIVDLRTAESVQRMRLVHRLVLEAFVGPCPSGMEACHNNGVAYDNRLSNLRWDTRSANQQDSVHHGTHRCGNMNKKTCPYGHTLVAPNLTAWGLKRNGARVCLACARVRAEGRRRLHRGQPVDLDQLRRVYYAEIMLGADSVENMDVPIIGA